MTTHDAVNHPAHYTSHPSGVECIDVVEHMGFNLGNAVKYIWRADEKGNAGEDLCKAIWYLERELQRRRLPHPTERAMPRGIRLPRVNDPVNEPSRSPLVVDKVMSILGYTAETHAPNAQPTNEYVTDRWMRPRRDALVALIRDRMAEAWDEGRAAERRDWELTFDITTPDEDRQPLPNPYRASERSST